MVVDREEISSKTKIVLDVYMRHGVVVMQKDSTTSYVLKNSEPVHDFIKAMEDIVPFSMDFTDDMNPIQRGA